MMLPKIIDLFSGCGGLTLGFDRAGFDVVGGIELMPEAWDTITSNLSWRYGKTEASHICGDITTIDENVFQDRIGDEGCIIIGGPPCQAYSLVGRAKLNSLGEDRTFSSDKRGQLYQEYLRFVAGMKPRAVVMENVPESVNYNGQNIPQTVCEELEKIGYRAFWTILNSADYGVPQVRERVFVLGIREEENREIHLPVPNHRNPRGELTGHQKMFEGYRKSSNFREPVAASDNLKDWVTVRDAFADLPVLFPTPDTKYHLEKVNTGLRYRKEPDCEYQQLMRGWFNSTTTSVTANCFRKTLRDFPIFARMNQGDNYIRALDIANRLLAEKLRICHYAEGSPEYNKLKKATVPPYANDKFYDKWKKLDETKPSHTLVAHLSVDTYSHIHPWEPRGISVREAARIQSFPDDFYFNCAMSDAYKQIGNAVPPLLAYSVAEVIRKAFEEV